MSNHTSNNNLGRMLKQRRVMIPITLCKLAEISGISASHLGRIERGERSPSARILQKLAKPLGFRESELLSSAGYLSSLPLDGYKENAGYNSNQLDPYVCQLLSREPAEVQHAVIGIIGILKSLARASKGG
jgi:transcriptional regulator with XRE-family HTH domain